MEVSNEGFLRILKSALLGEKVSGYDEVSSEEWQRLLSIAGIHSVLPMFYEVVYAVPSLQSINTPTICCNDKAPGYAASYDADYADE